MNIAIVGTDYVGLVSGACFFEIGINVTCVGVGEKKVECLKNGVIPIYEPGLEEMVHKNIQAGRLKFVTNLAGVLADVEAVFSAVGTPPDEDGSVDLKYVFAVAKTIGKNIKKHTVVVTEFTIPMGTAMKVKTVIQTELDKRGENVEFDVTSNPEFLKEGAAIKDFMSPDRIVVGIESERAKEKTACLYKSFMPVSDRLIFTNILSAEMIKYAANSMLATRIPFMNDIANLCELVGADVNMVHRGIGADFRIRKKFLYAGCGYGGSCFPKDVKALIKTAQKVGYDMKVLQAVESVNENQKSVLFNKLAKHFSGKLKGKIIAVWGLAFKPETDDTREAPALVPTTKILEASASAKVYDPVAMSGCKRLIGDKVIYCKDMYEAAADVDASFLITEWKESRMPGLGILDRTMKDKVIIDGRNIYDTREVKDNGYKYHKIGQ